MPEGTTGTAQEQQTQGTQAAAQQGTGAGDATQAQAGQNGGEDRRFTQAEVDDLIKRRLERERQQSEQRTQREREQAEEQRLKENQEFQKLAEQRQARIAELEPTVAKAERYEAALTKLLTEERKAVPEYVHPILDKLDPAEQLEWIAGNRAQFAGQQSAQQHANGTGATGQVIRPLPQTPRGAGVAPVVNPVNEYLKRTYGASTT